MRNTIKVTKPNGRWMHVMHVGIGIYVHLYRLLARAQPNTVWVNECERTHFVHFTHSLTHRLSLSLSLSVLWLTLFLLSSSLFSAFSLAFICGIYLISLQTIVHHGIFFSPCLHEVFHLRRNRAFGHGHRLHCNRIPHQSSDADSLMHISIALHQ